MKLRIHHFFDIIRDYGIGKEFLPHSYRHSYHKVAGEILADPEIKLEMVVEPDAVCIGCIHLAGSECDDIIIHRIDFNKKEDFNNYLDKRIMDVLGIPAGTIMTPKDLCIKAERYIDNIYYIYKGNDQGHTALRKNNVFKGVNLYSCKYNLPIKLI